MKTKTYIIIMIIGISLIISGISISYINYNNQNLKTTNISNKYNRNNALKFLENLNLDITFKYEEKINESEYKFLDETNSTDNEKIYYIVNLKTQNYQVEIKTEREIL